MVSPISCYQFQILLLSFRFQFVIIVGRENCDAGEDASKTWSTTKQQIYKKTDDQKITK